MHEVGGPPGLRSRRRRGRGRGRCCRSPWRRRLSGATPPSDARWAIERRMPSGTTPVPDGASLPRMTRSSAPARPRPAERRAARSGRCRNGRSRAPCRRPPTRRSMSASDSDVVPPLMCADDVRVAPRGPRPRRSRSSRRSTGRRCGYVETMPSARAQATIGAALRPVLTDPSPISPMRLTPAAAISAKSSSTSPSSRIGAPACTLTPAGPQVLRSVVDRRSRAP